VKQLQMCQNATIDDVVEEYMSTVAALVTSNDTLSLTTPGLDCLMLQGFYQMNAGRLQNSWVTYRRTITIAQLLNLHQEFLKPLTEENLMEQMTKKVMWHKIVQTERYLGMLIGQPCGTGDDCFGEAEESLTGLNTDNTDVFERKLCLIVNKIQRRNQKGDIITFDTTREIDKGLDHVSSQMSPSWWKIPTLEIVERSLAVAGQYSAIIAQMWVFQMKSFLHLPFLLRDDPNGQFTQSRASCLNGSREIIYRYLALRKVRNVQLMCKMIDFGAFLACVVLILNLLRHTSAEQMGADDLPLILQLIESMEMIARSDREIVVRQSVAAMKTMLDAKSSRNLRLTIPYFGTINLVREHHVTETSPNRDYSTTSTAFHDQFQSWEMPSNGDFSSMSFMNFESTQFPSMGLGQKTQDVEFRDFDEVFFDSVMDIDVGGSMDFSY
jgi:hypothetical protein